MYVPGATPVYIRGVVTATNSNTGEFAIRTATISGSDATGLLNKNTELVGIQPNLGGHIVIAPGSPSESRNLSFIDVDRLAHGVTLATMARPGLILTQEAPSLSISTSREQTATA